MSEPPRRVGICSDCGTHVLYHPKRREASCSCGATVIRPSFFKTARLGVGLLTGLGRKL